MKAVDDTQDIIEIILNLTVFIDIHHLFNHPYITVYVDVIYYFITNDNVIDNVIIQVKINLLKNVDMDIIIDNNILYIEDI